MKKHMCRTEAYPKYCPKHDIEFYRKTCGHGIGCFECDLERAVEAAKAKLPEELNGRLERAIEIVRNGHVYISDRVTAVKSQSSERIYEIRASGCNCKDARNRAPVVAGKPACKHQIACWLRLKMSEPLGGTTPEARFVETEVNNVNDSAIERGAQVKSVIADLSQTALRIDAMIKAMSDPQDKRHLRSVRTAIQNEVYSLESMLDERASALPASFKPNGRQLAHAAATGTSPKAWK